MNRKLGNDYWCPKCRAYKPRAAFAADRSDVNGVQGWCRAYHSNRRRKQRGPVEWFWKRFWERTQVQDDCLVWTGSISGGIPCCNFGGKKQSVRRLAYGLSRGTVPDEMYVVTTCGNERCVKQSHLRTVDETEWRAITANISSAAQYGRKIANTENMSRGEAHHLARLDEESVKSIREMYDEGASISHIARQYSIDRATVRQIVTRRTWKHIGDTSQAA